MPNTSHQLPRGFSFCEIVDQQNLSRLSQNPVVQDGCVTVTLHYDQREKSLGCKADEGSQYLAPEIINPFNLGQSISLWGVRETKLNNSRGLMMAGDDDADPLQDRKSVLQSIWQVTTYYYFHPISYLTSGRHGVFSRLVDKNTCEQLFFMLKLVIDGGANNVGYFWGKCFVLLIRPRA